MTVRKDFPALGLTEYGCKFVYLDSAATSLRPETVLNAMDKYYRYDSANPHRGLYAMAQRSTEAYDGARLKVASFINAEPEETIFVRNTSEALNVIAYCFVPIVLKNGGNIVIPISEHHSNLVTWQRAAKLYGAELRYLYIDRETGEIPDSEIETKIDNSTKIIAFAHVSNVTGAVLPVEKIVSRAKKCGAATVLDIAQSCPHMKIDIKALDVDFAAFSAHKMYGPMGIGALYGKRELLERMPPFLAGGDMIEDVREQETDWAPLPQKFEAGTQNAAAAVGFAAAVDYIHNIGWEEIDNREKRLLRKLFEGLQNTPNITVTCGKGYELFERRAVVSFSIDGVHPHDAATILDERGIAVRAGKHCAHPYLNYLKIPFRAATRASLGIYTGDSDIDALLEALPEVRRTMGYVD